MNASPSVAPTVAVLHAATREGEAALAAAVEEAQHRSLPLVVVATSTGSPDDRVTAVEEEVLTGRLAEVLPADLDWRLDLVAPGSDPTDSVVEHLESLTPRLVIVGSRRRSTIGKMILGRSVQRLLLEVSAQILVVKPAR
ncbi:universal stress protein [Nocardioides alkalitolerans]|uniref:universal stress protein n=1 Tax=Nocardioides alkalitolerans TaxID=281714 RepID=UPI0004237BAD|nr:universal stress protein [Nocardioides alkalitolerans]